ncbi:D-sedoheptulose-7-phosphate isomerase [Candidatus Nitrosotalea okcheonensis]|nr:SIS domain-containing protein [Candidatus Nitrosotalea okcheonensis]
MNKKISEIIKENRLTNQRLQESCIPSIVELIDNARNTLKKKGKVVFFGNGGSAADSQHIAAEFTGKFKTYQRFLPAIALTTNTSALTAISNDFSFDDIFSMQVKSLVNKNDLVIGISTSGNSTNVIKGVLEAKKIGAKTVSFTGAKGGKLAKIADIIIKVPSDDTQRIQEFHIMIGHILCELVN